ncbi:hypothetical protein niasHT_006202 [Heterodera trifolii]|uniref:Uncharacterized protein n=1 Tax=Heterodera trifolii TaxID=157864 RepID=A0ABD2LRW6_9BILA
MLPFTKEQFLKIAHNGFNSEYDPKRFHAIIIRLRLPKKRTLACLLFRSARAVLTGVPCPDRAVREAQKIRRRVQHALDSQLGIHELRVTNVVGSCTLSHRLSMLHFLPALDPHRFRNIKYDPTIFPAMRCKIVIDDDHTLVTCLAYHSGKIILTGSKKQDNLFHALHSFLAVLNN